MPNPTILNVANSDIGQTIVGVTHSNFSVFKIAGKQSVVNLFVTYRICGSLNSFSTGGFQRLNRINTWAGETPCQYRKRDQTSKVEDNGLPPVREHAQTLSRFRSLLKPSSQIAEFATICADMAADRNSSMIPMGLGSGAPYGSRTRLYNVKGCRPNR